MQLVDVFLALLEGGLSVEKESEELQVQQEMFSITSQILEEQKNTIQAIDEERSSLYKAICFRS